LYLGGIRKFIIRPLLLAVRHSVFALFGVMNWFLIGATVGANIVWIVALFLSYFHSVPDDSAAKLHSLG